MPIIPHHLWLSFPSVTWQQAYTLVAVLKHDAVKAYRDSWSNVLSIPNPGTRLGIINNGEERLYARKKCCYVTSLANQLQLLLVHELRVSSSYDIMRVFVTRFIIFTSMSLFTGFWEMEARASTRTILHKQVMELALTCTSSSSARHGERTTLDATRQAVDSDAKCQERTGYSCCVGHRTMQTIVRQYRNLQCCLSRCQLQRPLAFIKDSYSSTRERV
jgi:hypothetical protein